LIKAGDLDYVLAGGSDSFFYVAFVGFQRLYAMAQEKCSPLIKTEKDDAGEGYILLLENRFSLKRNAIYMPRF